ncbi:hypothetical protein TNCV_492491 [Trichonephila clavipes]|nr:hypothetical protein TNCV_492491 [Trichonephila clavipes]
MHNATVQQRLTTVSTNSNPTIVMLQSEAGFFSKHNVVPLRCQCPPFIAPLAVQTPVDFSQGRPVRYNSTFIKVRIVLVRISVTYTRHHKHFSPGNNVEMQFVY